MSSLVDWRTRSSRTMYPTTTSSDRPRAGIVSREPLPKPRLMACLSAEAFEPRLITDCARLATRLRTTWYAVYVADAAPPLARRECHNASPLAQNLKLAAGLGARVVRLRPETAEEALPTLAYRAGITHVMTGEHGESGWPALWAASTLNAQEAPTAVLVMPAVDAWETLEHEIHVEFPPAGDERLQPRPTRTQLMVWASALAAVAWLFVWHAPAVVCFAGAAALAVFWCWDLDRGPSSTRESRDPAHDLSIRTAASETR
jgi:K+-sensing histidine kinase KdpD